MEWTSAGVKLDSTHSLFDESVTYMHTVAFDCCRSWYDAFICVVFQLNRESTVVLPVSWGISEILNIFNNTNENDECIMCGISYWHVDRNEIDNILVRLSPKINIKMINPYPPKSLTAVLTSLFKNFVLYPKSNILERLIKWVNIYKEPQTQFK